MGLRRRFEHAPEHFVGIGRRNRFAGVFLFVPRGLGIRHGANRVIPVLPVVHVRFRLRIVTNHLNP